MEPLPLYRTLEQELAALVRGISLECLVCGEFVMQAHGSLFCPECGTSLVGEESSATVLQLPTRAG